LKVVLLSDTHGQHRHLEVPPGDLLIHAGDMTMLGELEILRDFNEWIGTLPHPHKLVCAGNHDLSLERDRAATEALLTNARYCRSEGVEVEGKRIWLSPWTPAFGYGWAFQLRGAIHQRAHWEQIPEGLDVLVTHGPPSRILDRTLEGEYAGDPFLLAKLHDLKRPPKIHVFGHIHEAYGSRSTSTGTYFNASVLDRRYKLTNRPWVVEI
jgi:predicted phosphodiesterase